MIDTLLALGFLVSPMPSAVGGETPTGAVEIRTECGVLLTRCANEAQLAEFVARRTAYHRPVLRSRNA